MLPYNPHNKSNARKLRNNMTDAERLIWSHIRRKQIFGVQFYRQKPIAQFIVDFYAPKAKLVIEIDGAQHLEAEHLQCDQERDAILQTLGLQVLCFDNYRVLRQINDVLDAIYHVVEQRLRTG